MVLKSSFTMSRVSFLSFLLLPSPEVPVCEVVEVVEVSPPRAIGV
jgi:hypothetical protein